MFISGQAGLTWLLGPLPRHTVHARLNLSLSTIGKYMSQSKMLIRLRAVFLQELVTKNNSIKVKVNVPYSYTQSTQSTSQLFMFTF